MAKKFEIRNSTAEFLIFQIEGKESGVQAMYHDETVWCTQKAMAELFDVGVPAISKHLKNIFRAESCRRIQLFPKWKQLRPMGNLIIPHSIILMPL